MIVDLHLGGKNILIVGSGNEALKRVKLLENEGCQITVLGEKPHPTIKKLSEKKMKGRDPEYIHDLLLLNYTFQLMVILESLHKNK